MCGGEGKGREGKGGCFGLKQAPSVAAVCLLPIFEYVSAVACADGCFHDGQFYIDFDGRRSKWHPRMSELCLEAVSVRAAQRCKTSCTQAVYLEPPLQLLRKTSVGGQILTVV